MEGLCYLTDLAACAGLGRCSCKEWTYRIQPRITRREIPVDLFDPKFNCKHLLAARRFQYGQWFQRLMADEPPENL